MRRVAGVKFPNGGNGKLPECSGLVRKDARTGRKDGRRKATLRDVAGEPQPIPPDDEWH